MNKKYESPEMEVTVLSFDEDVLLASPGETNFTPGVDITDPSGVESQNK